MPNVKHLYECITRNAEHPNSPVVDVFDKEELVEVFPFMDGLLGGGFHSLALVTDCCEYKITILD